MRVSSDIWSPLCVRYILPVETRELISELLAFESRRELEKLKMHLLWFFFLSLLVFYRAYKWYRHYKKYRHIKGELLLYVQYTVYR